MKKFTTLAFVLLISLSLFAARYDNILTISSNTNYKLVVMVDGRQVSQNGRDDIRIDDLRPGYHSIKIYRTQRRGNNRGRNSNGAQQLFYQGNINVRASYHVDVTVNRFGRVYVDERLLRSYNENDDDNNQWNNQPVRQAMSYTQFNQLKQTISNSGFEHTKLIIAKQQVLQNYFTAQQVKELVQLLTYENNKLDLAKHSYRYCVDQNAYFVVNDAFTYSNSKEELSRYIAENRN